MKCQSPNCPNDSAELIMGAASPGEFIILNEVRFKFCIDCLVKKWEEIKKNG